MCKFPCRGPLTKFVGLTISLLLIGTNVAAETLSVETPGNAAVTKNGPVPLPFSPRNMTDVFGDTANTAPGVPDLPQSSIGDANSSKPKDSPHQPQSTSPAHRESTNIAWGPLLGEAFLFASIENGQRACCEIDTGPELKGVLLSSRKGRLY